MNKSIFFPDENNASDIPTTGDTTVIVAVVSALCVICTVTVLILLFECSRCGH